MNTEDLENLQYEHIMLCFLPEILMTRGTDFLKSRLFLAEQASGIGYSWAEEIKDNILWVLFERSKEYEKSHKTLDG